MLFLVSDFRSLDAADPRTEQLVSRLNRRHDLVAVRVVDPFDRELPAVGPLVVRDLADGTSAEVDGRSAAAREQWRAAAEARRAAQDALFARARVDVVEVSTDGDVDVPLIGLFRRRAAGRGGRA